MGDYYEVIAGHVDRDARRVAHEALRVACGDWGIRDAERPRIAWFSAEDAADRAFIRRYGEHVSEIITADGPGELLGRTIRGQNIVWVQATTDLTSLAETVAHEVAHLVIGRQRGGGWTPRERAVQEALADRYGRRFLEEDHR